MHPGTYAAETPDRPAATMSDTGEVLTFAELEDRSTRIARLLHDRGLRRGDNFAVITENRLEMYVLHWAALRSGLYLTAVNYRLNPAEISYIVNDCGARGLFVSAKQGDTAAAVVADTSAVEFRVSFGGPLPGHESYEELLASTPAEPLDDMRVGGDMLYSSGTTGQPKAVKLPLQDRRVDETGDPYLGVFGPLYGFDRDTVFLVPAPLYHSAPLRFGMWVQSCGGTVVVMPRYDADKALEAIEKYRVTHGQFVPTMFIRMLKLPQEVRDRYDVSSLRAVIHAAAPCPVDVKQQMIDWWGPVIHEFYSSTESNGITLIDSPTWLKHPGSVGQAGLGTIHICDDSGADLPVGEVGTIYFERDARPFEYHNDPVKTKSTEHPDHENWTTAGDLGRVDDEGFLYLTDRKAFMIISGGVNIYPQEVENALALHPKVLDVAVIGIPDEEMGEQVKAVVQVADGVEPGPDLEREIIDFLRDRIAHFKVPRTVDFVDELPRTATGKLIKGLVKAQYV